MTIYLAADHAGFELKEILKDLLVQSHFEVEDCGAFSLDPNDDYPDFIANAAEKLKNDLTSNKEAVAIILGGSGQGEAMVANKFTGIRAAVYYGGNKDIVILSKEHNDANVLSLGARFLTHEEAKNAVLLWLQTTFTNEERHKRRVKKINSL